MFDGQYETALKYARKAVGTLPAGDKDSGVQFMLAGIIPGRHLPRVLRHHAVARHGALRQVGRHPRWPLYTDRDAFPATIATQHYARGVAYASKGMVPEAEAEQVLFLEALKNPALAGGCSTTT